MASSYDWDDDEVTEPEEPTSSTQSNRSESRGRRDVSTHLQSAEEAFRKLQLNTPQPQLLPWARHDHENQQSLDQGQRDHLRQSGVDLGIPENHGSRILQEFFKVGSNTESLFKPLGPSLDHYPRFRTSDPVESGNRNTSREVNLEEFPNGYDPEKTYTTKFQNQIQAKIDEVSKLTETKIKGEQRKGRPKASGNWNGIHTSAPVNNYQTGSAGASTHGQSPIPSIIRTYISGRTRQDDIWDRFNMKSRKIDMSHLAVSSQRTAICQAIATHQIIIIEGFTGCGKTTQVPQYILEEAAAVGIHANVVVTQPRRIAAQSVAQRVSDERGWDLGGLVGYQVGLKRQLNPEETRLIYMTTGVLLQKLITKKSLEEFTHVIIDEVHERDLETDLLLLVIKKLMVDRVDKLTKVILMSATINTDKFSRYFPDWVHEQMETGTSIVKIPDQKTHQIHEFYLDTFDPNFFPVDPRIFHECSEEPKISQEVYETALQIIISLDSDRGTSSSSASLTASSGTSDLSSSSVTSPERSSRGSGTSSGGEYKVLMDGVLCFLPGLLEIQTMEKLLREYEAAHLEEWEVGGVIWWVIPLHSSITREEQQSVFRKAPPGVRKIILATNIAESSITVSDIKYVIDFCLTKSLSCDPQTNYSMLRMEWASKNQTIQRKGRVGRVSEGYVYRMVPRKFWAELHQDSLPEMEKASLESVVLNVKNLDLGSPQAILALAVDPPKVTGIRRAVANLKEVGALTIKLGDRYTPYDGNLTSLGKIISALPIDITSARLIVLGHIFGVLEEAIIIAAGLSVKSPFSAPFQKRLQAYMSKLTWSTDTFSDCFAILNLYKTWQNKWQTSEFLRPQDEKVWARNYYAQIPSLKEMYIMILEIQKRLSKLGIEIPHQSSKGLSLDSDQGLFLKIVIAGAFYPNYFVRYRPEQKEYEKSVNRELVGKDPLRSIVFHGYPSDQPGDLYAAQIWKYFRYPIAKETVPQVDINGSKVLVSFDNRGFNIGTINLNVYRGIKMRQTRSFVTLKMMRADQSNERLTQEREYLQAFVSTLTMAPFQTLPPSILESQFPVVVTDSSNPSGFWVRRKSDTDKFRLVEYTLEEFVQGRRRKQILTKNNAAIGILCLVEDGGRYYRGRIDWIDINMSTLVFFLDTGMSVWKSLDDLLYFDKTLCEFGLDLMEGLALHCRLHSIKPASIESGVWSPAAIKVFQDFVEENASELEVEVHSVVESIVAVDLKIIGDWLDGSSRRFLIKSKLGAPMEESFRNKSNSGIRHHYKRDDIKINPEEIQELDSRQVLDPVCRFEVLPPAEADCDIEYTLRGPSNPLEMQFSSLCRGAHMKLVHIDGSSVNSVALDQEHDSRTSRLLVASVVGIAQRSGNIQARDTTIMPNVPGLVGMLTMLFCPKLEFRVDRRGVYTGCLSGLGMDPETQEPAYPDHDVEVVFDTKIDRNDINQINSIRSSMNLVLRGDACNIENVRGIVTNELKQLLARDRPYQEESWPETTHKWGMTEDEDLLSQDIVTLDGDVVDVFPLHGRFEDGTQRWTSQN